MNRLLLTNGMRKYLLMAALLLAGTLTAGAQTNYVFYNATYGYLYNDNGTTKSGDLRFDKSSVWTASGTIGGTSRTIQSYTSQQYLGASAGLSNTSSNWRGNNNYLCYRTGGTNYYLKATSATTFTTNNNQNNGQRYAYYTVTIYEGVETLTDFTINSGADVITQTGNYNYGHSNSQYTPAYTDYYFSNTHHYVGSSNNTLANVNATNVTTGYTWTLSDNAAGYATLTDNTINVTAIPTSDLTLTLTCSVTYQGITKTATKLVTIQGTKPSAPIISVSGNTATLSTTAVGSTTIRYTLDGTDPTASTGTVYSGAIDLSGSSTSPVTIKAITVRNGNASDITEQSVTLTLPEPTITINGEAQTASISSSVAGVTIYYTTDGTTPTTSSTQYTTTLTGLAYMTNVKAIAVKDGWNNSPVASGIVTIPSGVGGGVVTLFDYEPHSWSYYSDPDCPVRSLSPADVTITYYGDGVMMTNNNNYAAGTTDTILPGNTNYQVGAKVNVNGEDENTFVYYKTLERGANTDDPWTFSSGNQSSASSRCPYTTIPNPFQVRPRYGARTVDANDFTGWRGFQCWRLKSVTGGAVYSAASGGDALTVGAVINAETKIYFAPSSEYGMEVELEAVWARAYVKKANQANENPVGTNNVGYERNFCVPTTGAAYTLYSGTGKRITNSTGVPVTISRYYPDGTAPDNTNNSISNTAANVTLPADTKFENIPVNVSGTHQETQGWQNVNVPNTLTANNHDLIIGRGCSGTMNYVRGVGGDATAPNYTIRIESGTINYLSLLRGYWTGSNAYTDNGSTMSGNVDLRCVLGCDYDRATNKGVTNNLIINNNVILGAANTIADANKHRETTNLIVKSGKIGNSITINSNDSYMADAYQSIYMSVSNSQQTIGQRKVLIEGGEIIGIAGGIDAHYLGTGVTNNNVTGIPTPHTEEPSFSVRMTGGKVRGCVYGGAAKSPASGNRRMVFTGGTINGWVGCGCNGTEDDGGKTYGESFLYFGGETRCEADPSHDFTMNGTLGGYVFGAGKGFAGGSGTSGEMTYGTNVAIADNCYVQRNVYGGGNYGYALVNTNLYVAGGTVHGKVFGGSNQKNGPVVNVKMIGGIIEGGLYGGSDATGTISGKVTMQIDGGQVGTSSIPGNIHGGGYGQPTRVNNDVEITLGSSCTATEGVTVYGDVYGGSALGYVNGTAAADTYHTYVTLNKGTIFGSLYGGGLGDASNAANVYGPVQVKVFGGSVKKTDANGANGSGAVYGCNNINGAPQRAVSVDIYGTDPQPSEDEYALFAVYGGGNQANYSYGTPTVTVHNCNNSIEYVYGGGNAAHITNGNTDVTIYGGNKIGNVFGGGNGTVTAANVTGNATTKIYGGKILKVFGGSNSQGTIGGTISVTAQAQTEAGNDPCSGDPYSACAIDVDELYGGGNLAASNVGNISIGCMNDGDMINYVYGGANQANITGNIELSMTGGRIGNLFGGNNISGNISGSITVEVNWDGSCSNNHLGNVYGGGNLATFGTVGSPKAPTVNILNGTVSGNVYGGGKGNLVDGGERGEAGKVTGNPTVNIGDNNGSHTAIVLGDVYGGGDAADVAGTPAIVINDCNTEIGYLYGGGNAADVNGTSITFNAGTVHHDAFGGGHGDKAASNPSKYADVKGNVVFNVYGGTFGRVFAGSNSKGDITGSSALTINKTGTCAMKIGEVYGGGNEAAGNAGSVNIGCTGSWTTGAGNTHDNANLSDNRIGYELEGIGTVYGGANQANIGTALSPSNISLNVNSGMVNRVFGGNNTSGDINGTIAVNINKTSDACGWYVGDVFGGGNHADYSGSPTVTLTNGTVSGNIFGGGNEAGVGGSTVNINGGAMTANKGIYGGCNSQGTVTGNIAVNINGGTLGTSGNGNALYGIFGGGLGENTATEGNITVTIGDLAGTKTPTIYGDIYGGSALGSVNNEASDITKIDFLNGTLHGTIFGGGMGQANVDDGNGNIITDNSAKGQVNGTVQVNISKDEQDPANCHIDLRGVSIYGCNNTNGSPQADVTVNVWKTGFTTGNYNSQTENAYYAIDQVFGGGKNADYLPEAGSSSSTKKTTVHIHECLNTIRRIFSGGDAAAATGVGVIIEGGRFDYVFGGGNGENVAANIGEGGTNTVVHSGIINHLFGGSNERGTITGQMRTTVDGDNKSNSCAENIHEFFGGGNKATIETNLSTTISCGSIFGDIYGGSNMADIVGNVTLTINGGTIDNVYAGSKGVAVGDATYPAGVAANIAGNVTLNINSGDIGNAFGGSNINGNITGKIAVTVDWSQSDCAEKQIDNVYGGSNLAVYTPTPALGNGVYSPLVTLTNGQVGRTTTRSVFPAFDQTHMEGHGRVFGAGKGDPNVPAAGGMTARPKVWMNTTGGNEGGVYHDASNTGFTVLNAIYGGGEVASVTGSTLVQIDHGHVGCEERDINHDYGFVFGGGKGDTDNPDLANISDSSTVVMKDGYVHNTIFGGGQIASVGTFTRATASNVSSGDYYDIVVGEPISCANGTGITSVRISGGQVGPHGVTMEADLGYVFGAGMGYYTQPDVDYTDPTINGIEAGRQNAKFGYVDSAEVCISDSALIVGAVWGGSENGQVLHNCGVKVKGGQIGLGKEKNNPYSNGLWNRAINAVKTYNADSIKVLSALMPECESWEYSSTYGYLPYDAYIDEDVTNYGVPRDASTAHAGDGHTFFGNVFGGGSGYYPYRITVKNYNNTADSVFSYFYRFQGRVRGNTYVDITGGHILTSIYGGCEYADVEGDCHVSMTGGTLGVPRTVDGILSHPVTCYLFGAGKGDQRTSFNMLTNVSNAYVTVGGEAVIFGSVFGGGEDGHVKNNAVVNIKGNAFVGTSGTSYYDGNIFGGGRGFGGTSFNAGTIGGNTTVNISGNCKILGNIYGGGRLASVGGHMVTSSDPRYGYLQGNFPGNGVIPEDDHTPVFEGKHGVISVNISGGTIGSPIEFNPYAFSTGRAFDKDNIVKYNNNIYRFTQNHAPGAWNDNHAVLIEHTTGGNVFGGSMGRLFEIDGVTFNHLWPALAKCRSTMVTINGTARIYGNVYGGGELGYVMDSANVIIDGSAEIGYAIGSMPDIRYTGSIYGGGYGSDNITAHVNDTLSLNGISVTAAMHSGRVYGNTRVTMNNGQVWGNIYGGGEMASVGRRWINMALNGAANNFIPYNGNANSSYTVRNWNNTADTTYTTFAWNSHIGNTRVIINGGTVGNNNAEERVIGTHRQAGYVAGGTGGVFGGGKGHPGMIGDDFHYTRMAYVDSTNVIIKGGNITGAVFGGGENGHVRFGTLINMTDGTVGIPLDPIEYEIDEYGYSPQPLYVGNLYGGGRGVDHTLHDHLGAAAGQVYGGTKVEISGGRIYHNVYGGGSLASVGRPISIDDSNLLDGTGHAIVTIKGNAVIGDPAAKGLNSGRVFGSGRGVAGQLYAHRAYVRKTTVTIGEDSPTQTCHVYGSVFGSGENGHVQDYTHVYIKDGCMIGELWNTLNHQSDQEFVGNVYGGGRGVDLAGGQISRTAGLVRGSTHITVTGGQIFHNVYGGGSLASVGDTVELSNERRAAGEIYAKFNDTVVYDYDAVKHTALTANAFDAANANGHSYIFITGGKIGTNGQNNGRVFGGGRGNAGLSNDTITITAAQAAGLTQGTDYRIDNGVYILLSKKNPANDSVIWRDYTNHTYVTGTHIVVNYPSFSTTTSYPDDRSTLYNPISNYNTAVNNTATSTADEQYIRGSVFGGGDNGHVRGNTQVVIENGRIGTLTGNVNGDVFGGGSGGVGDFTVTLNGAPAGREHDKDAWLSGLGTVAGYTVSGGSCYVTVSGGRIGEQQSDIMASESSVKEGMDSRDANLGGNVFGSSRGQSSDDILVNRMAYTNNTNVTIENEAQVAGSVFGGGENGHVFYTANVNIDGGTIGVNNQATSGSIYRGNAYGGGRGIDPVSTTHHFNRNSGLILGNSYLTMTGGTVYHNVFGGGSLASLGTYTYIEEAGDTKDSVIALQRPETGKTEVTISGGTVGINGVNNGNVFGAGRGLPGVSNGQKVDLYTFVDRTYVTVGGTADIRGNVFGSGDNGHVLHNTQVVVYGGTIGTGNGGPTFGNVFGSGRGADTYLNNSSEPTLSPVAGRVYGSTDVYVVGGILKNNVYGGGYLATVDGNTNVTVATTATVNREGWNFTGAVPTPDPQSVTFPPTPGNPSVYGDVFGGSALGAIGSTSGTTTVNILGGTIGSNSSYYYNAGTGAHKGNIFGGGNGDAESQLASVITTGKRDANVRNTVHVNIGNADQYDTPTAGAIINGAVFGGNNIAGSPTNDIFVDVYSTQHTVGTNDFNKVKTMVAALDELDTNDLVAVDALDDAALANLFALNAVYGGGNKATVIPATSGKTTQVTIHDCDENTIQYVYGGGNAADLGSTTPSVLNMNTDVIIEGGHIYQVFAGGNGAGNHTDPAANDYNPGANVYGDASVTIKGGAISQVFGGSNSLGMVHGASMVAFDNSGSCQLVTREIYGGGNVAPAGNVVITIPCGTTGLTDVYGGANNADIGTRDDPKTVTLNILGGDMTRVFGGNKNGGTIYGNVTVNVHGSNPGHTISEVFGGCNLGGGIVGNIIVNIDSNSASCPLSVDYVYGGGNLVEYAPDSVDNNSDGIFDDAYNNPARISPQVNIINGSVNKDVFGGGLGTSAVVTANTQVNIYSKVKGNVFGGGNAAAVTGNTNVNVQGHSVVKGNVFGGGNEAAISADTKVIIKDNPHLYGNVYGGGNRGPVGGNTKVIVK